MRRVLTVVACASVLALAACSSSSSSSAGSTPSSSPAATSAAAASHVAALGGSRPGGVLAVAAESASSAQNLTTFATAVHAAGLDPRLSGAGPFTVFAPTDAAFASLPGAAAAKLLLPCNRAELEKIVLYHVVPGEITSDVIKPGKLKTLEGSTISISTGNGEVAVNDSGLIDTGDLAASNGIVKPMVGAVLVPPGVTLKDLRTSC